MMQVTSQAPQEVGKRTAENVSLQTTAENSHQGDAILSTYNT